VVGYQKDEEIHTDQYGRVKVHFPWVRKDEHEKVSCWVRVAQIWAGTRWGGIFIPRVGQEVIVEFLEADPDRPIITGRVYNADNMPPYDLPANKTQSGIQSRSTKGGNPDNYNEMRFEDKKGEEQLYMQAEKNMDTLVKNDQSLTVMRDRKKEITRDETSSIGRNRSEQVVENETIAIGGDRVETVQGKETISIIGKRTETVAEDESITISKSREKSVGVDETLKIGKNLVIEAGSSITIKTGAASITMKSNGDIVIDGKNISVKGSGRINANATGNIIMRGSNIGGN
jgi:type VI secretion system secreted protein VgrG